MADQTDKTQDKGGQSATHGQSAAHASAAQSKKDTHWQKLANHTKEMMDKMNEILQDPASSAEDKAEAQETMDAMTKIQFRLQNRYGVTPQ